MNRFTSEFGMGSGGSNSLWSSSKLVWQSEVYSLSPPKLDASNMMLLILFVVYVILSIGYALDNRISIQFSYRTLYIFSLIKNIGS
jgi:hypothetical protein